MKCEWVRENILLLVYNELADDARYEMEQHLSRCAECAAELKATRNFHVTLSKLPVLEPTPNLLTAARMRLQESLETAQQGGFWQRLTFDPANWLRQVRFAPALAAAIFIIGFAGGMGATSHLQQSVYRSWGSNSSSGTGSIVHHGYSIHQPGAGLQPDQHQIQHRLDPGSPGIPQRPAHPAITPFRRA